MAIDPRELRRCLGHFTTGVTVITCQGADGAPHGATVNAFTAVSLEPPLVLVSLDRRSTLCALVAQQPFDWMPDSECGAPRLGGTLAHVSCTPWQHYDGGDHVLYLGEVQDFVMHGGLPLLFHTGKFHHLGDDHRPVLWGDSADGPEGQAWITQAVQGFRNRTDLNRTDLNSTGSAAPISTAPISRSRR